MTKAGESILQGMKEAVAHAKGESDLPEYNTETIAAMQEALELDHDPIVDDLIRGTNNIVELAYSLYAEHEETYYKLGGILLDIKRRKLHVEAGYQDDSEGFSEYVQEFIGPKKRSAYYIMSIYRELRELGVTATELQGIGWTKARMVKDVPKDNKLELLEKAKNQTRQELEDWINGLKKEPKEKKVRFTFSLHPDAAELANQALDFAMALGADKNAAFEQIISHYLLTEVNSSK